MDLYIIITLAINENLIDVFFKQGPINVCPKGTH